MDLISEIFEYYGGLLPLALIAFVGCIVAGLTIWGVIAAGNNIRRTINRDTELQREKKQKEIELIQAQINYYNRENEKGT